MGPEAPPFWAAPPPASVPQTVRGFDFFVACVSDSLTGPHSVIIRMYIRPNIEETTYISEHPHPRAHPTHPNTGARPRRRARRREGPWRVGRVAGLAPRSPRGRGGAAAPVRGGVSD